MRTLGECPSPKIALLFYFLRESRRAERGRGTGTSGCSEEITFSQEVLGRKTLDLRGKWHLIRFQVAFL